MNGRTIEFKSRRFERDYSLPRERAVSHSVRSEKAETLYPRGGGRGLGGSSSSHLASETRQIVRALSSVCYGGAIFFLHPQVAEGYGQGGGRLPLCKQNSERTERVCFCATGSPIDRGRVDAYLTNTSRGVRREEH